MNAIHHSPAHESARIFLGDASISVRDLNAALLRRADQPFDAVADLESGPDALQEKGCNLLVIDYKLPGRAGLRLIVKMRAPNMAAPVVLTSITIDADELSRNSRFKLAAAHTETLTAGKLLELAGAVLQIAGRVPVEIHPPELIASIERRLQTDQQLSPPVRLHETV
jgi:DNA-binding NtrC family response regulator